MNRSSKEYKQIREKVKKRDDEKCIFCGRENNIVVHHIIPRKHGGEDNKGNMVTLCQSCHMTVERNMVDKVIDKLDNIKQSQKIGTDLGHVQNHLTRLKGAIENNQLTAEEAFWNVVGYVSARYDRRNEADSE